MPEPEMSESLLEQTKAKNQDGKCGEVWIDIAGTNYQISNRSRVRLVKYVTQQLTPVGYPMVALSVPKRNTKNGMINRLVHRLVAEAFIPNTDNLPFVNHKDGNKQNSAIANLEWVTASQNTRHAVRLGLIKAPRGEQNGCAKLKAVQVKCIRKLAGLWKYSSMAPHFGIATDHCREVGNSRNWRHIA